MEKPQTPEEIFLDGMDQLLKMDGGFFNASHLEHVKLVDTENGKELVFLPGCRLRDEVRAAFQNYWQLCNRDFAKAAAEMLKKDNP